MKKINKELGKLCRRGHKYKNTDKSLRYKSNGCCVDCVNTSRNKERADLSPEELQALRKKNTTYITKWKKSIKATEERVIRESLEPMLAIYGLSSVEKSRKCLSCLNMFNSVGNYNKICPKCKREEHMTWDIREQKREEEDLCRNGSLEKMDLCQ